MNEGKKEICFPAKRYGYGWVLPIHWQGWIVLLAYVILVLAGNYLTEQESVFLGYKKY
jgi:hypothetical protein